MKSGLVYKKEKLAGKIWENEAGCHFQYNKLYLANPIYGEISKTLPLREKSYVDENMISFFDGLIPEGWLLKIAVNHWKLNSSDRMSLLLMLCQDNIGDVSIRKEK